eukprot:m51a1_g6093 putative calcium calmodulin-dependent 3 -cyclic nucleotide phosphodiesterase 1a isoform x3 (920) ;mRNA; r:37160-40850
MCPFLSRLCLLLPPLLLPLLAGLCGAQQPGGGGGGGGGGGTATGINANAVLTTLASGVGAMAETAENTAQLAASMVATSASRAALLPATLYAGLLEGLAVSYPGAWACDDDASRVAEARALLSPACLSRFCVASGVFGTEPSPAVSACPANCTGSDGVVWAAWCPEGVNTSRSPCAPCRRACEVALGRKLGEDLQGLVDTVVATFGLDVAAWRFTRGNGTAARDWQMLWANTSTLSLAASGGTLLALSGGAGYSQWVLTASATRGDDTAVWGDPHVDAALNDTVTTVGVPVWTSAGDFLGGVYADVSFRALQASFDTYLTATVFILIMTTGGGDVVAASSSLLDYYGLDASATTFNVALLNSSLLASTDASSASGNSTNATSTATTGSSTVVVGGMTMSVVTSALTSPAWTIVVLQQTTSSGSGMPSMPHTTTDVGKIAGLAAGIPVFVLGVASAAAVLVVYRRMRARVRQLEVQLGSMSSSTLLGTPAEEVVRTLLRIERKTKRLSRDDHDDLVGVISLIASNKLYKAGGALKSKLGALNLDKDVDAYLLDVLAREDSNASLRSLERAASVGSMESGPGDSDVVPMPRTSLEELATLGPDGRTLTLDDWDYSVESVKVPEGRTLLEVVGTALLDHHGLIDALGLPRGKLTSFLRALSLGYRDNPYHSVLHAADVAQGVNVLLRLARDQQFTEAEKLSVLLAALMHDYAHGGLNNNYLAATMDPLFCLYNGVSALENMHCSRAFALVLEGRERNFLERMGREALADLHRAVVQLVLGTDMARHLEITTQLSTLLSTGNMRAGSKADRALVLSMILKLADVSNPARPWEVCRRWTDRVMREFFAQGDAEREAGLPVSPFMDRQTTDVPKCQSAFIQFVVAPTAELAAKVIPGIEQTLLPHIRDNAARWKGVAAEAAQEQP